MANYTRSTNFTAKDALASGNPSKVILGSEHDAEYDAIATAIATKLDSNGSAASLTALPAAQGGACALISQGTALAVADIQFTSLSTSYHAYMLIIHDLLVATSTADIWIQTSTNNGSSWTSGGTDYRHIRTGSSATGSPGTGGANTDSKIIIANSLGNSAVAGNELKARIFIHDPLDSGDQTAFEYQVGYLPSSSNFTHYTGYGIRAVSEATNAFRILASSGTITTCTYALYGFKAS